MTPSIAENISSTVSSSSMISGSVFKIREREEAEIFECKKRASLRWLVNKAYNNSPPEEFKDPFYRDYNNMERLKPHLVHALANAELYGMALGHLFQDPNFHNLNNWGIIQALARKGVYVCEPNDCSLTETVLIQTGPLKISAHLAVIDALMNLFIKECTANDRILESVKRFSKNAVDASEVDSSDPTKGLIFWVNQSCQALRITLEDEKGETKGELPKFTKMQDVSDLSDGICLASVCALYCPSSFFWTEISFSDPDENTVSLRNMQLLQKFCAELLPYNFFHLTVEDMFYMHNSIRLNVECMIADMFSMFELSPNNLVVQPGVQQDKIIHISSLEHNLSTQANRKYSDEENNFVVQKGRMIPTLSSVVTSKRSISPNHESGRKERLNQDTKWEERGESEPSSNYKSAAQSELDRDLAPAGRPSERSDLQSSRTYAGRRTRRNSTDDNQSQISLENIGGSTENISVLGRNPDKEMRVHSGKRSETLQSSIRKGSANQQTFDVRRYCGNSDSEDNKYVDNKELDAMENIEIEEDVDNQTLNFKAKNYSPDKKTSFADLRKKSLTQDQFAGSGIHITYSEGDERDFVTRKHNERYDKDGSFAQETKSKFSKDSNESINDKLNSVRVKLEERRKRIEEEKRKTDTFVSRQGENSFNNKNLRDNETSRHLSPSKVISNDKVQSDPYSKSILNMNDHINEMNSNIQRLAAQQNQIQQMMQRSPLHNSGHSVDQQPFYVTSPEQTYSTPRRTWGQPQPISFAQNPVLGYDRPGWGGGQMTLQRQPMYDYAHAPMYDKYNNPVPRDQWGNILPPPYGGNNAGYMFQNGQSYPQQSYPTADPISPLRYTPQYGNYNTPNPQYNPSPTVKNTQSVPFRLHDIGNPNAEVDDKMTSPTSNVMKRDPVDSSKVSNQLARKIHAPVPAPAVDDMAPQNISFIESASDVEEKLSLSPTPTKAPNVDDETSDVFMNLKRTTPVKDKTYRLQLHADGREPTTLSADSSLATSTPKQARSTISSSFKERRSGSSESGLGPSSLSNSNSNSAVQTKLTNEEIETLNNMKTEVLKETGDPAKGFVISFDDESTVKPKPVLKERKFSKRSSKDHSYSSDPVMIMLDMNEDIDSDQRDSSPNNRSLPHETKSKDEEKGYNESNHWNSYDTDELASPSDPPKFAVDPDVPLEPMIEINDVSDSDSSKATGLIIGDSTLIAGEATPSDMAKKKERIILQSLRRKQMAEANRAKRDEEARLKKEAEAWKAEEAQKKKEEDLKRREAILEAHRLRKEQEKAEEEGRNFPSPTSAKPIPKFKGGGSSKKPRPKTMLIEKNDNSLGRKKILSSSTNLSTRNSNIDLRRSESRNSLIDPGDRPQSKSSMSLATMGCKPQSRLGSSRKDLRRDSSAYNIDDKISSPRASRYDRSQRSSSQPRGKRDSSVSSTYGLRNDSFRGSRESLISRRTYTARRGSNSSLYEDDDDFYYSGSLKDLSYGGHKGRRKSSSTSYLGPGSLPSRQRRFGDFDDGISDVSSTSGWSACGYRSGGSRLGMYREPATKSNRPIVMNAIEHVVFPGVVNRDTRMRVLEEIDACDCPHFLILFRDAKCQFRGLYAYYPDTEEVFKIYGTGPKQITDKMFEKFFKYNSGGKKFTQIHTKSLTVTIDAFTIHNSLWLGKKAKLPDKRSMALVV